MATCEPQHIPYNFKASVSPQQDLFEFERQEEILKYKRESKLINLNSNLQTCGFPVEKHHKCKKCIAEGLEPLLKITYEEKGSCQVRYCKHDHCTAVRYAKTLTALENTSYPVKKGFRKIDNKTLGLHFSIGYKRCGVENIKETKKQMDRQMNFFMQKLRKGSLPDTKGSRRFKIFKKQMYNSYTKKYKLILYFQYVGNKKEYLYFKPIEMSGIKVFDIKYYFDTNEYLLHYHFCIFPLGKFIDYNIIQQVRKDMIANSKSKKSWHLQIHGNPERPDNCKDAKSILRYMTKRAIGIFGKSDKYDDEELDAKKIGDIWKDKRVYGFADFMSVNEYFDNFYNSKAVTYFGRKLKKYIYNGMLSLTNPKCRFHGKLRPEDILTERIIIIKPDPPPDIINSENEPLKLEFIKIGNKKEKIDWVKLGQEYLNQHLEMKKDLEISNKIRKEKEFSNYMQKAITEISNKYKISVERMTEAIVGKGSVADIKKQKLLEEMGYKP